MWVLGLPTPLLLGWGSWGLCRRHQEQAGGLSSQKQGARGPFCRCQEPSKHLLCPGRGATRHGPPSPEPSGRILLVLETFCSQGQLVDGTGLCLSETLAEVTTAVAVSPQLPRGRGHPQLLCHLLRGCLAPAAALLWVAETPKRPAAPAMGPCLSRFLFLHCLFLLGVYCSADSSPPLSPLPLHKPGPPSPDTNRLSFLLLKQDFLVSKG